MRSSMKQSFFDFEIISLQIFQVTILAKPNDLQFRRLIKTNSVPNCIRDERAQWEKREMERFMGPDPETKKKGLEQMKSKTWAAVGGSCQVAIT